MFEHFFFQMIILKRMSAYNALFREEIVPTK